MQRAARRKQKKEKKKGFMFFRLSVCLLIICAAVFLKYADSPLVSGLVETIKSELKVDEAIEVISNAAKPDDGVAEVFDEEGEAKNEDNSFDENFYIDDNMEALQKEIDEERKKREEEEKKLSVETLSFQMSEEEMQDDTKAEPFRIPPPSSCSYDKVSLGFKYRSPLYGVITSKYGYRDHPIINDASFHTGLDIAAKKGTAIVAFADGKVIEAGKNSTYGNYLLIEHKNGIRSFYGHNSKLLLKKGATVKLGQKVAEVGSTGLSTGPHLHFEVRNGKTRLDPAQYISSETI